MAARVRCPAGLPWATINALGYGPIRLLGHRKIITLAYMQLGNIALLSALLLVPAFLKADRTARKRAKAQLTRPKARVLLCAYVLGVLAYLYAIAARHP